MVLPGGCHHATVSCGTWVDLSTNGTVAGRDPSGRISTQDVKNGPKPRRTRADTYLDSGWERLFCYPVKK
jgi:hypothetical protein